jgi:histidine triad (HIT) family protein
MTLFQKILARQIPADIVYEDEWTFAFRDIHPQAPTHILVCPREPIAKLSASTEDQATILGRCLRTVAIVAESEGLSDYRVAINNGAAAGQTVFHLHLHLLGGRGFGWPPG